MISYIIILPIGPGGPVAFPGGPTGPYTHVQINVQLCYLSYLTMGPGGPIGPTVPFLPGGPGAPYYVCDVKT